MIELSKIPTAPDSKDITKKKAKKKLKKYNKKLFNLQNKLFADNRYGVLIILQGMDTAGKDGIVRHVIRSMNPMGINIKSFGVPTEEERSHDFLWRIYKHMPKRGEIGVFNRSYYEDILVPSQNNSLAPPIIEHRYKLINEIEEHLKINNIKVLKLFLHISREEQKERIEERKEIKRKKWKYDDSDVYSDKVWDSYQRIYETIFNHPQYVDWHIIPSDKRWYRNYKTAKILKKFLKDLDLKYPDPANSE